MHIIDGVMSPLNSSSTPSPTPSSTGQPTTPANSRAAAPSVMVDWKGWGVVYVVGIVVLADLVGFGAFGTYHFDLF